MGWLNEEAMVDLGMCHEKKTKLIVQC